MTTRTNPARGSLGKSTTAGMDRIECAGGCRRFISAALGYAMCITCYRVNKTCKAESAESLAELSSRHKTREEVLGRVADLLRRTRVDDAEVLIRNLERLTRV